MRGEPVTEPTNPMSTDTAEPNLRPDPDRELTEIADYVCDHVIRSDEALDTARNCLMDSLACALLALQYPECLKHLGPIVPGTLVPNGARVPGTQFQLDPVKAAWDIGALVRWLDFNDTWLAAEWGHPSDNLGAILGLSDWMSRTAVAGGGTPLPMGDLLGWMVKAHEIQGVLALENSFNRVGLDHVVLVKVASTAVATRMLGGDRAQVIDALSHAWVDGQSLRAYRHAPNTGSRKSWAAGDASSRGLRLGMMVLKGEMGLPSALTAATWGFPAEFHGQTAVECALALHPQVSDRLAEIERIELSTQESALRIISKKGPLYNSADRDHCLQYMVAVALIYGELTADHYEDAVAADPRIDALRAKMRVSEDPRFTAEYLDPDKRAIGNAVQVFFKDGTHTARITIDYPIGHRRRRAEGIPLLEAKFLNALHTRFPRGQAGRIFDLCRDAERLAATPVHEFTDLLVI